MSIFTDMATRLASTHQGRLVCGARRPADAGDQHLVRSSPQRHRAETLRDEGVSPPRREPTGISHGARPPVQPHPVSASSPACRSVWRGSGRRTRTHRRLVSQSADPHLGRLSMSDATLHHIIRVCPTFYTPGSSAICGPFSRKSAMSRERYFIA